MNLREVALPDSLEYSFDSNNKPYDFYYQSFEQSKNVYFLLGYFSSNAIQTIIPSFCQFLNNDGKLFFAINQFISRRDYNELFNYENHEEVDNAELVSIFEDMKTLRDRMSKSNQFFFNCLRYLHKNERLNFVIIKPKSGTLSHYKKAMFDDGENQLLTNGSSNFTANGLVINAESFDVSRSWGSDAEKLRIENFKKTFRNIYNNVDKQFEYLSKNDLNIIEASSNDKSLKELLLDGIELLSQEVKRNPAFKEKLKCYETLFREKVEKIENEPRFPFDKPRDYQAEAYKNWVKNNYKGIFAMATGTGKTLTSLNAVLELYRVNGFYNAIILVPTQVLVTQWIKECEKFNFKNIFSTYDSNWADKINNILLEKRLGINTNFIFISTYASYNGKKFQKIFKNFKCPDTILIADEAHNLGTKRSINNYLLGITKRIGLSATPNRNFDEKGTYEIEKYFNSFSPNHTFNYSMLKAIKKKYLTPYYYYPKFVKLNDTEMSAYAEYSERLLKFFDFEKGRYKEEASNLLIQRKRIIHQASSKKNKLIEILSDINNKNFKHTIVYVPEGFEPDYSIDDVSTSDNEDLRIIDDYNTTIKNLGIKTHQIIGGMKMEEREKILNQFNRGIIQVLTAMKTLDEGVDIPATKCAIFCASTGNPRQFIQRRGRILRKYNGKDHAIIYDLIVEPNDISYWNLYPRDKREKLQKMEINIFRNELYRIANFMYASENLPDLHLKNNPDIEKLINLTELYKLDLFTLINELIEKDLN